MGKSGKSTLEERINETVFPHLFEGIEAKCHICGSGRKKNLRPRIYLIKNKFQAIFVCMRCERLFIFFWLNQICVQTKQI